MKQIVSFICRTCCVCACWQAIAQEPCPQPGCDQGSRQLLANRVAPNTCAIQTTIASCCDTIAHDFYTTGTMITHIENTIDALTACEATPITASQVITAPGSYCLANDIGGNLWIEAPNVMLDLNGHTITGGVNGVVIGCAAQGSTVRNGRIIGAEYAGIIVRANNCTLKNLDLTHNYIGAFLKRTQATNIAHCRAIGNSYAGYTFMEAQTTCATTCQALGTTSPLRSYGFIAQAGADNSITSCLVQNTQATSVSGRSVISGINLAGGETRTRIQECAIDSTLSATGSENNSNHKAYGIYVAQGIEDEGITFQPVNQFDQGNNDPMFTTQWTPTAIIGNSYLATGGSQGADGNQVRIFDNSFTQVAAFDHGPNAAIHSIDWLQGPASNLLAIVGQSGTSGYQVRVLDFTAPATLTEMASANFTHGATVNAVDWLSSGTSRFLAIGGAIGSGGTGSANVRVLEFSTTTSSFTDLANTTIDTAVNAVAWQTIGSDHYLAVGAEDGTVAVFQYTYSTLTPIATFNHGATVKTVAWQNIGSDYYLAIGGAMGSGDADVRVLKVTYQGLTDVGSYAYGYQKNINVVTWFIPDQDQNLIIIGGQQNEAGDSFCVLEFNQTTSRLALFRENICYDFQLSCSIQPEVNAIAINNFIFSFGGAYLFDTQELVSLTPVNKAADACRIINNTVDTTIGENAVGIFVDSNQHYVAGNYACNTWPQNSFPPTIYNYSLIDSLFLSSQANARGVTNIDCTLPSVPDQARIDFTTTYTMIGAIINENWSIESKCEVISDKLDLRPAQLPIEFGQITFTPLASQTISEPGSYFLRRDVGSAATPATIIITADNVTLDLNDFSVTGSIQITNCSDITLKNGKIMGQTTEACTMLETTTNVYIHNVSFIGGQNGIAGLTGTHKNLVVKNCQFFDYAGIGIECNAINGLHVDSCYFHSTQGAVSILTANDSNNIEIANTQFILEHLGTYATGCDFDTSHNIVLRNCVYQAATGTTNTGVYCNACDTILIENCTAKNISTNGFGFIFGTCQNGTLRECEALGATANSKGFYTTNNCLNITMDRCIATDNSTGFAIDGTEKITLERCIAQANNIGFDFTSTCTKGLVQECIAHSNTTYGFNDAAGPASAITYAANIARDNNNNTANYNTAGAPFNPVALASIPKYWANVE